MSRNQVSRRQFLAAVGRWFRGLWRRPAAWGLEAIANPLSLSGPRWEKAYRDLWKYDSTFTFQHRTTRTTHSQRLRAFRCQSIGPTMLRRGERLDGNHTTHRWDPARVPKGR